LSAETSFQLERDLICHYTINQIALEHILPSRQLQFSSLALSHDPIEFSKLQFIFVGDYNERQDHELNFRFENKIQTILKNGFKICCFSGDLDHEKPFSIFDKAFCRSRMWVQYAERHSGICLKFSKSELLQEIEQVLSKKKPKLQVYK
jgi:hypothetical protein